MILSVIIPVYKSEKTLNECVDSVLKQAPTDCEIILVDDGSPDNCPKICDEYANKDNRIKVIHKPNGGISSVRNVALDVARGEYIFFLDSDDYLTDNYIEKMLSHKSDLVIGNFTAFYSDGTPDFTVPFESAESISTKEFLSRFDKYFGTFFNFAWGKLYRRALIGNLRFEVGVSMVEDVLFNLEIYRRAESISLDNEAVLRYRQSMSSLSKAYNEKVFGWYMLSYGRLKSFLLDMDAFEKNENAYNRAFMGNVCECVRGIFNGDKSNRKKALKEICENESVIEVSKKYKSTSFLMFGINSFIKHKSTVLLSTHIWIYKKLAAIKHIFR